MPVFPVVSSKELELSFDGVAEENAVLVVPERHAVVEAGRSFILQLECPMSAGVVRFVDARCGTRTRGQQVGLVFVEGFDVAEVKRFGAGDDSRSPSLSAIDGAKESALRAAGPCDAG